MKGKLLLSISLLFSMFILSGCGENAEEKVFNKLEETVEIEEGNEATKKLNELEAKDKSLLNEIAALTEEDLEEINKKSDEAIKVNKQLKDTIEEEQSIYSDAEKQFKKSESSIDKIEEEPKKEIGLKMYKVMMERYDTYKELVKEYQSVIDERIKFYELMKDKDVKEDKVFEQVDKINKYNEKIMKLNDEFNKSTEEYNKLKKEFYEKMDLNIKYEN